MANDDAVRPPERIYLQWTDDPAAFPSMEGITWAEDRIEDTDPEYIRADLAAAPAAPPAEQLDEVRRALEHLIEACDDSDDARYGTLRTSFVRHICSRALAGKGEENLPTEGKGE